MNGFAWQEKNRQFGKKQLLGLAKRNSFGWIERIPVLGKSGLCCLGKMISLVRQENNLDLEKMKQIS